MKTIQDLKDNKAEIIEVITEEVGVENVKKVMEMMVNMIGFNGYFNMTASQMTKAVIAQNEDAFKVIITGESVNRLEDARQMNMRSCKSW